MTSRREFLLAGAAAGAGLGLGGRPFGDAGRGFPPPSRGGTAEVPPAHRALRILFLGGTGFLGPQQVEYAIARGHTVTLFNRGRTGPELFPGVETLIGDRSVPDYASLRGREWDAVIDNSASIATWVRDATTLLKDSVGRYLFVSSLSAHSDNSVVGMKEDGPVFTHADYEEAIATGASFGSAYGPNKAEAERITLETLGTRGLVVRPGLIVGPGDRSDRFTYWPVRIDRGGEVVAPGDGSDRVQIVDVRDLAEWMVRMVEDGASGTFNAVGPEAELDMAGMLNGIRAVTSANVKLVWVSSDILRAHEVGGWIEMPVWVYPSPDNVGFSAWDCSKAIAAGLTFRPLADTARDTLEWWKARPEDERRLRTGLSPEKEAAILAEWHARNG